MKFSQFFSAHMAPLVYIAFCILVLQESLDFQLHYVCVSWDKVKELTAQKKWRIFVLKDIEDDFMLWIDTVILYHVSLKK